MERKKLIKFGIDWAAILALALCMRERRLLTDTM